MAAPTAVKISVAGTLNRTHFTAHGRLAVNPTVGTKAGRITFTPLPRGLAASPNGAGTLADSLSVPIGRCFVGAKPVRPQNFVEPLRILGREFWSDRLTEIEGCGTISQSERAWVDHGTLVSDQLLVGDFELPEIATKSFSSEVLEIAAPDTMRSTGECTFATTDGKEIRVRFSHFYRALHSDRTLFRENDRRKYLLCFDSWSEVRRNVITYRTKSLIGDLDSPPAGRGGRPHRKSPGKNPGSETSGPS